MDFNKEYERWLECAELTETEHLELLSIKNNPEALELRFSSLMDFGTAGLRSQMHLGIGCMNRFTVAHTTRGIAELIKSEGGESRGVAIAYDSRNNSREFAKVSASVLAGAGIKVYIFDDIRPTPELSFALRELGCMAGINITASHNPKEYNGYKAYWEDGAQISPEQARVVSSERAAFDVLDTTGIVDFNTAVSDGRIIILDTSFDELYLNKVLETGINKNAVKSVADSLSVVYSPLHGAGYRLVPEIFRRVGLKSLYTVQSQMIPDGNFPTVKKPNPEYAEVFKEGIEIADRVGSDLIIATDPDADRVGVMTRCAEGGFITISGNQMGALLLDYAIKEKRALGLIDDNSYCVKSLVSTDMAYKIAKVNGVRLYDVLTGFKFIGEVIKNAEERGNSHGFILGFEESYGYLLGSYARDKDAVGASMMILEMAAYYKSRGMTLADALEALYREYGYYHEKTVDIYMEGLSGIEKRRATMQSLRDNPPTEFGSVRVCRIADYKSGEVKDLRSGESSSTGQPTSDVLSYTLESEDKIIVRPSGTEPKIKIYILANGESSRICDEKIEKYSNSAKRISEA